MFKMHTSLTDEVRAELTKLGVQNVLRKLDNAGIWRGALVGGFECGDIQRDIIEDWVAEQGRAEAKLQARILFWAIVAACGTAISIVIALVGLWLQQHPQGA